MAKSFVDSKLRAGKVTVFEKVSCPFCVRTKTIINKYKIRGECLEFINIADMDNVGSIQDYLCQLSGERTVPRIFIEKECIGGCSDLVPLDSSGELERKLKSIGALE